MPPSLSLARFRGSWEISRCMELGTVQPVLTSLSRVTSTIIQRCEETSAGTREGKVNVRFLLFCSWPSSTPSENPPFSLRGTSQPSTSPSCLKLLREDPGFESMDGMQEREWSPCVVRDYGLRPNPITEKPPSWWEIPNSLVKRWNRRRASGVRPSWENGHMNNRLGRRCRRRHYGGGIPISRSALEASHSRLEGELLGRVGPNGRKLKRWYIIARSYMTVSK